MSLFLNGELEFKEMHMQAKKKWTYSIMIILDIFHFFLLLHCCIVSSCIMF
jgi:hypothetical protein